MPWLRSTSVMAMPPSASLRIATIWLSVNLDFFIKPPVVNTAINNRKFHLQNVYLYGGITNAFIERFNRTYRHEVLSAHIFENLNQVKDITELWIKIYNEDRPHAALGKLSPAWRFPYYRAKIISPQNKDNT